MAGLAAPPLMGAGPAEEYRDKIRPILEKHCYHCHGADKQKADLNLAIFSEYEKIPESPEVWQLVLERIQAFEMPPAKEPELGFNKHQELMKWLRGLPKPEKPACDQLASDRNTSFYKGYVMSRRLNRAEYNHTVRDLIGVDLKVNDLLPADGGGGEGFDTTGSALFTSTIHIEKYLAAADRVLETVLSDKERNLPRPIAAARKQILITTPRGKAGSRDAAKTIMPRPQTFSPGCQSAKLPERISVSAEFPSTSFAHRKSDRSPRCLRSNSELIRSFPGLILWWATPVFTAVTWKSPRAPIAREINPQLAYQRLFGVIRGNQASARDRRRNEDNRALLDLVPGASGSHHEFSHHQNKTEKYEPYSKINRWHSEQLAYFLDKLRSIKEGERNLLDNSMILFGSSMSDGNRHDPNNLPIVLAGRAGGKIDTGRYIACPKNTPICNLYVSMLERMGTPVDAFGDSTAALEIG